MTVQELIDRLKKCRPEAGVEVAIGQYNQRYPIAYSEIQGNDYDNLQSDGHMYRIEVNLPSDEESFMVTSTRKKR